ncbi:MAG: hypothetical protein V1859_09215 [archaeon]
MNKTIIFIVLLSMIWSGCSKQLVGNDNDIHGCKPSTGYSWDETIFACVRAWELDEGQAKAAKIVVAPMSVMPRTIVKVETLNCTGCFIVYVQPGDSEAMPIKVLNWKVSYGINNFDDCVAAGNPVMESYPRQCAADGKTYAEDISHVCTNAESMATACTADYNPVCGAIGLNMGKTVYQTFGNSCMACAAMKVISYTPGECPPEKSSEMCSDGKGNYLTLTEAIDTAKSSECKNNLMIDCSCPTGYRKEQDSCNPECYYSTPKCLAPSKQCEKTYFCNEGTGTYWINMNITKQGCSPACVISLEKNTAEINWRCIGALIPR